MAMSEFDRQELVEVLAALCDGRLDDSRCDQLRLWLEDPEAQDCFASYVMLDACLGIAYADPEGISLPPPTLEASPHPLGATGAPPVLEGEVKPASPVLGFLGNLATLGGGFTPVVWTLLILISVSTLALVTLAVRGIHVRIDGPEVVQSREQGAGSSLPAPSGIRAGGEGDVSSSPAPLHPSSFIPHPSASSPIARLVRSKDCHWNGHSPAPGSTARWPPENRCTCCPAWRKSTSTSAARSFSRARPRLSCCRPTPPAGHGQGHRGNQEPSGPRLQNRHARGPVHGPGHRVRRRSVARRRQQGPRLPGHGRRRSKACGRRRPSVRRLRRTAAPRWSRAKTA